MLNINPSFNYKNINKNSIWIREIALYSYLFMFLVGLHFIQLFFCTVKINFGFLTLGRSHSDLHPPKQCNVIASFYKLALLMNIPKRPFWNIPRIKTVQTLVDNLLFLFRYFSWFSWQLFAKLIAVTVAAGKKSIVRPRKTDFLRGASP